MRAAERLVYTVLARRLRLNKGNHGAMVRVNPFVGTHAIEVMRLQAELGGSKYVKGGSASYASHIGELLPDEYAFEFHVGEDLTAEAERLAQCIAGPGLKYMKSISTYDALLPLVAERMPMLGGYPERYVLILFLTGKQELAVDFIDKVLRKEEDFAQYNHDSFNKFASNFLKKCS
jgi:hypothetical protein